MYTGATEGSRQWKKDARARWKRTVGRGATKSSDTGVSQNGKKEMEKRKKNHAQEKVGWSAGEKKDVRSEVPVSCLLQDSQRHEAKGTPLAKERATEVGLGSFHTKARIYDKGGPLTPWHLASKLTLLPTWGPRRRVFPSPPPERDKRTYDGKGWETTPKTGLGGWGKKRVPESRRQARCSVKRDD